MLDEKLTQVTRCEDTYAHPDLVQIARAHLLDESTATQLAHTFKALSDPTRVRLISALSTTEMCVCDIAAVLGMSQSAVSHQLGSMRDMRLVKNRKVGRVVYYSLDDAHIADLYQRGLEHIHHK